MNKALSNYYKILAGKSRPRFKSAELNKKVKDAFDILKNCELCERKCNINRLEGKLGFCKAGNELTVSSMFWHFGEESILVPSYTIFLGNLCTFRCVFCQNYDISQLQHHSAKYEPEELAKILDSERRRGVLNWNWVGSEPTPSLPFILKTLSYCKENCPSIWNSNMYMSEKSMKLLEGTQDVFLTDFKYGCNETAEKYSGVKNYWETVTRNHLLARKQAELIIRILVMPGKWIGTDYPKIVEWIAENLGDKVLCNIMKQYHPEFKAYEYTEIGRRVNEKEMQTVIKYAEKLGLNFIT